MKSIPCVRACLTGGLLFTQGLMVAPADTNPARVVVASWNVENLFDADDDPLNPGDDEYTPGGWTRWTEARYRHKLTNLVDVVHEIRPDILCVMEVENRRVLDDLADLLTERHGFSLPWLSHRDSPDQRGIDTAILSRIKPVDVAWLRPHPLQRDVVIATFAPAGHPFTVLVNHWKSRYGKKAVSDAIREREARAVRAELDRRLRRDPAAAILVVGDFNDNVDSQIPRETAGFALDEAVARRDGRLLFNLSATLPEAARGTYFYSQNKRWNSFDMINITRGLLTNAVPASPWQVRPATFTIHAPAGLRMGEHGAPYPFRRVGTKQGERIYSGYSDHFPVHVTLEARP